MPQFESNKLQPQIQLENVSENISPDLVCLIDLTGRRVCLDFLRNIRFISKFMMKQTGKKVIAIHILPNISRSKDNQTHKFAQLINRL